MDIKEILSNKKLIHSCKLWNIYELDGKIIFYDTLSESEGATIDEYKKENTILAEKVELLGGQFVISDARNFKFPIDPDIQTWVTENITPRWMKAGVKKCAVIMPEDFIANLGTEQLSEEVEKKEHFTVKYFAGFQEAFNWFNK